MNIAQYRALLVGVRSDFNEIIDELADINKAIQKEIFSAQQDVKKLKALEKRIGQLKRDAATLRRDAQFITTQVRVLQMAGGAALPNELIAMIAGYANDVDASLNGTLAAVQLWFNTCEESLKTAVAFSTF